MAAGCRGREQADARGGGSAHGFGSKHQPQGKVSSLGWACTPAAHAARIQSAPCLLGSGGEGGEGRGEGGGEGNLQAGSRPAFLVSGWHSPYTCRAQPKTVTLHSHCHELLRVQAAHAARLTAARVAAREGLAGTEARCRAGGRARQSCGGACTCGTHAGPTKQACRGRSVRAAGQAETGGAAAKGKRSAAQAPPLTWSEGWCGCLRSSKTLHRCSSVARCVYKTQAVSR